MATPCVFTQLSSCRLAKVHRSHVFPKVGSAGVAMAAQQLLRKFWLSSSPGHLSKWEQAKALGLREASKEIHGGQANVPWSVSAAVTELGGRLE